jgi:hypothetical protein
VAPNTRRDQSPKSTHRGGSEGGREGGSPRPMGRLDGGQSLIGHRPFPGGRKGGREGWAEAGLDSFP